MKRYDAAIVGARCGGASTAMLLARRGCRVLLADRASLPSEIPHGHFIHRHGPRRLWTWGLLDRAAAMCPAVTSIMMDLGDFPLAGHDLAVDGVAAGYGPRRATFDAMLVEAACAAGAELRPKFAVTGLLREGDRIVGIRGRAAGGAEIVERAAITIGADGRHSFIARAVDAPCDEADAPVAFYYFSYWSGMPTRGLELIVRSRAMIFSFPTNDGLTAVFVGWPIAERDRVRRDVEGSFLDEGDFVRRGTPEVNRDRESLAIGDRHDLRPLAAFRVCQEGPNQNPLLVSEVTGMRRGKNDHPGQSGQAAIRLLAPTPKIDRQICVYRYLTRAILPRRDHKECSTRAERASRFRQRRRQQQLLVRQRHRVLLCAFPEPTRSEARR